MSEREFTNFVPGGVSYRRGPMLSREFADRMERESLFSVKAALESGELHPENVAQARVWIANKEHEQALTKEAQDKAVKAHEISIAERAASAAERSARWAQYALVISVVALLLAALPYIPLFK